MCNQISSWPEKVFEGMEDRFIGSKTVYTYKNMPSSLYQALRSTVKNYPDKVALVDDDESSYTYRDYLRMVDELADYLYEILDVRKGSHVGVILGNGIEFCVTYLAVVKLGAVFVSLPGKCKKPEILSLAEKAQITHLICERKYYDWFESRTELRRLVCDCDQRKYGYESRLQKFNPKKHAECSGSLEDPVILMFTSGTTSLSKGVLLKNYNVMHSVEVYIRTLKLNSEDRTLIATPMYHITGLICILAVFLTTGGTVCMQKKVEAERILSCCIKYRLTFYHASPTVFALLLEKREKYPNVPDLKSFACGSGNMAPEKIRKLYEWMPQAKFHTVYGMTETSGAGTIFPGGAAESPYIGSSGIPMPNLKIKILDENEKEQTTGKIGEVCLKGTFVLEEYYEKNVDSFTKDGWLKTGDLGYLNEAGYLYIVDRKKDMINRGGEKICSYDVENEIHRLQGISDVAVVAVEDEKYMEVPAAMVKINDGCVWNAEMLKDILKNRMARYKIPVYYKFVDEIPTTQNGKIDKKKIKEEMAKFVKKL
jgi:fatty-acyl-CoA synthase/long-chain acyl-CoA synthetase